MFLKCLWGFFGGLLLGLCAAIVILVLSAIVAKVFTIAPDEHFVFWLAVIGLPALIVIGYTLASIVSVVRAKSAEFETES